jgi:molecular chaperone HscB
MTADDSSMDRTSDGTSAPAKCRQCKQDAGSFVVCQHCRALYDAEGVDHFALLGLPRTYDLDAEKLRSAFLLLSRQVHPDYFAGKDSDANGLALRNSARLNRAYRTLKDSFDRAEYLLELAGGHSSSNDRSVAPELLAEVMEIREQAETAKQGGDQTTLVDLRDQVLEMRGQIEARIAYLARRAAEPDVDTKVLGELRRQLNAARYISNLLSHF